MKLESTELLNKCHGDLIKHGTSFLADMSDTAILDTQLLLCFVLDKPRSFLFTWPDGIPSPAQIEHYVMLLNRRVLGEPISYLTGNQEFWSLCFEVSPATLIPRPDTETLVELVLALTSNKPAVFDKIVRPQLLDLGTGSGAIALALASELPSWKIDAVDFSVDAVNLAKRNAKRLNLEQVTIFQSDWFSQVTENSYHVIVSNPPYIASNDHHLGQGDIRFEPLSALVADENGYSDLRQIATEAKNYLALNGYLFLEHGFEQGTTVRQILADLGYSEIVTSEDLSGNERITWACLA